MASPRSRALGILPSVVGVGVIVWLVAGSWDEAVATISRASVAWLAVALMAAFAAVLVHAVAWGEVIRMVGGVPGQLGRPSLVMRYMAGALGKYVPGGIWSVVGLGEAARRAGVSRGRAYAGFLLFVFILYAANVVVAGGLALAMLSTGHRTWELAVVVLCAPVPVLALHPRLLRRAIALLSRLTRRSLELPVPEWQQSLRVALVAVPSWVLVAVSTWAVARALLPDPAVNRLALAAMLSWLVGFLAGPVPAGAGVREAVFVVTSGLPLPEAAAVALVARLVFMVVDGVAGAAALAHLRA